MPSRENRDNLTPVPALFLENLDMALKSVRADLGEMKPQVKQTHDSLVRIEERVDTVRERVRALEEDAREDARTGHECAQENLITALAEQTRESAVRHASVTTTLETVTRDLGGVKEARRTFNYWLLGAIAAVIAAAIGWIVTLATVQTRVEYLQQQQAEIRNALQSEQRRATVEGTRLREAVERQSAIVLQKQQSARIVSEERAAPAGQTRFSE